MADTPSQDTPTVENDNLNDEDLNAMFSNINPNIADENPDDDIDNPFVSADREPEGRSPDGSPADQDNKDVDQPEGTPSDQPNGQQSADPPANPDDKPSGDPAQSAEGDPPASPELDYSSLAQEVGLEFSDRESLVNTLNDLRARQEQYQSLQQNRFADLPELAQAFVHFAQSGEGEDGFMAKASEFMQTVGLNVDSLDARGALKARYMLEHADLARSNPRLAERSFEREYNQKYPELKMPEFSDDEYGKEDKEKWLKDNPSFQEDQEYYRELREHEAKMAKDFIAKRKEEVMKMPQAQQQNTEEQQKKAEEFATQMIGQLDKMPKTFEIPVSDDASQNFKIDFSVDFDKEKEMLVNEPEKFLKEMGFDFNAPPGKQLDLVKIYQTYKLAKEARGMGKKLFSKFAEMKNLNTIEKKLENPASTDAKANAPINEDPLESFVKAAAGARTMDEEGYFQ